MDQGKDAELFLVSLIANTSAVLPCLDFIVICFWNQHLSLSNEVTTRSIDLLSKTPQAGEAIPSVGCICLLNF